MSPRLICLFVLCACAHGRGWLAVWATSPEQADRPLRVAGQTLRQVVRVSLGGDRIRLRLSNAYGKTALHVGAAHLAIHGSGPSIAAGTDRGVTFGGSSSVSIPPGALVVSDPVALAIPALSELAVSLYLPDETSATTVHETAQQTAWLSVPGDFTGAENFRAATTTQSWYLIAGVEAEGPGRAVVAFGDSITDGLASTPDANHRWPDYLAERLKGSRRSVVNAGISGNRVLDELGGASALVRLDRDVLVQPGAKYVIFTEGINDIGMDELGLDVTADQIIAGHRQIILRAHALGLRVIGGTLTPYGGARSPIR